MRRVDATPSDDAPLREEQTLIRTRPREIRPERRQWVHQLVVVEGPEPGRRYDIGLQPLSIGRRPPSELIVPEPEVSSRHCEVSAVEGSDALRVVDLNSTNGSFIDGTRISGSASLRHGGLLLVGRQLMRHEFVPRREAQASALLDRDLDRAMRYVQALLPAPLRSGPLLTDWMLKPSTHLGGDAFGCQALDEHRHAIFLIDVSGHGTGAAMHTVSVLNVLRQRALPDTDPARPEQVLARLNDMFQMDSHGGMVFTIWYGVHDRRTGLLEYGAAGHHAAYLVDKRAGTLQALHTRNLMIGAMPGLAFAVDRVAVHPGQRLYLFSDGVFEITLPDGGCWNLGSFLPLLQRPDDPAVGEAERLHREVRRTARPGPFDDDFTILVATFSA